MDLPMIGLGTWELRGTECTKTVQHALELGYRHIDTAHVYDNHAAIRQAIQGHDRTKLYLTSKIAIDEQVDPSSVEDSVRRACEKALQELGIEYLDLYLIHWPNRNFPLSEIHQAMVMLVAEGKIVQAGVSNYTIHHLQDLRDEGFTPFANQVEYHPYLQQTALRDYCRKQGISVISYRSLGKGMLLQEEPLFETMGQKYGKTGAQVILRWLIQQEIAIIPKASSTKHLKENLELFDFSLTETEMRLIDNIKRNKRYCDWEQSEFSY